MKLEIINPSDKCYLETDDIEAACFMTMIISKGKCGLKYPEGKTIMPPMMFGGDLNEFWKPKFEHTVEEFLSAKGIQKRFADVCDTFYYEREPTSLNDIGAAYKSAGEKLRKTQKEE